MQCSKNQHFAQRLKPVFSIHAPLVSPLCVAIGAPLESKPAKNTGTLDEIVFTDNAD